MSGIHINSIGLVYRKVNNKYMDLLFRQLDGERTPLECELQWKNLQSTALKKDRWTAKEDNKLLRLVKKYDEKDWQRIAREHGVSVTVCMAILCIWTF